MDTSPTKMCTKCGRRLPLDCFHRRAAARDGRRQPCKECTAKLGKEYRDQPEHKARKNQQFKLYYRTNPEFRRRVLAKSKLRRRRDWLKRKFCLTESDIQQLRANQMNRCAICSEPFNEVPNIDHDHKTGKVRGLLCGLCNKGLGLFKDSRKRLIGAIEYLDKANQDEQ